MSALKTKIVAPSSALGDSERLQQGIELLRSWGHTISSAPDPRGTGGITPAVMPSAWLISLAKRSFGPAPVAAGEPRGCWNRAGNRRRMAAGVLRCHQPAVGSTSRRAQRSHPWPLVTTLAANQSGANAGCVICWQASACAIAGRGWTGGIAEGPLLVGNLTVATHLLGTKHCPNLAGRVLLLEDVGEAPYRIDRLLTHWRLSGALQQLAGLGFGRFEGCEAPDDEQRPGFALEEVLRERSLDLGIPVVGDLPFGHGQPNAALPWGEPCGSMAAAAPSACSEQGSG